MNGLYSTPLTGMRGADYQLDMVADNIANLNTSGFQSLEPILSSQQDAVQIGPGAQATGTPAAGAGTAERSQTLGPLTPTGNPLDLAIQGEGFFTLRDANGQQVYARQVTLRLEPDGQVATAHGLQLSPPVRAGATVTAIRVDAQGGLIGETRTGTQVRLGRISSVNFPAPENLRALGGGVYAASLSSGRPGASVAGSVRLMSGYQYGSGVDLSNEMVEMVQAERMYEINGKALQTLDSMVSGAINLQSH